jgi:hypothetical protein
MIFLAKAALALGGTVVMAGAYTFHEGVIRVDVDESRAGGSHVHFWAPAAVVPMAFRLIPKHHMQHVSEQARQFAPVARAFVKELKKFPDFELVDVQDTSQHVQIRTHDGKLQIDVVDPAENVHLLIPLAVLDDISSQLEANLPGA